MTVSVPRVTEPRAVATGLFVLVPRAVATGLFVLVPRAVPTGLFVLVPRADRGPQAGSPLGVVDPTGYQRNEGPAAQPSSFSAAAHQKTLRCKLSHRLRKCSASTNEVTTTFCKSPTRVRTREAFQARRRARPSRGAKSIPIVYPTP